MNQISIWFSILARDVLMSAVRHCFFESCTVLVLEIGQWPHWGFLQITSSSVPPRMTVASSAASSSPCAPLLWHFISLCLPYNWDLVLNWNNPSTFVLRIQTARWDRIFSPKNFRCDRETLGIIRFPNRTRSITVAPVLRFQCASPSAKFYSQLAACQGQEGRRKRCYNTRPAGRLR